MRSIAVVNQKGGVGKTTTAVNLAAGLVQLGRRVMLVDLDPQAHASMHVGVEVGDDEPSIYDVLVHGVSVLEALRSLDEGLIVLPAHLDLVAAEIELAEVEGREQRLINAIAPLLAEVEFCIIDCAPSLGVLSVNALAAAHEVMIPLQPHFLALQGLGKLLDTVTAVRDSYNASLRVSGIVLTMSESGTRLGQEVARDVASFLESADAAAPWAAARLCDTRIRRNIKLAEAPSFGQTVFTYAPTSHGAEDYLQLAHEIAGMRPLKSASAVADAPERAAPTSATEVRSS